MEIIAKIFSLDLLQSPLFLLTLTLFIYYAIQIIYIKLNQFSLFNPLLITMIVITTILYYGNISYEKYFKSTELIYFLLAPATIILAVPLFRQLELLQRYWFAITCGILSGIIAVFVCIFAIMKIFNTSPELIISVLPKSVTTPIAMIISEMLGGIVPLTITVVILTGICAAVFADVVFKIFGIKNNIAMGVSLGAVAHGIGTSQAFIISPVAGAFASLAMGISGILISIITPLVLKLFL